MIFPVFILLLRLRTRLWAWLPLLVLAVALGSAVGANAQVNMVRPYVTPAPPMISPNTAVLNQVMQMQLLQQYAADDTAMAIIRMFKRKRGSRWPWLAGGLVGGVVLTSTAVSIKEARVNSGQLYGGMALMLGGGIAYAVSGKRYSFDRLTEVLIAREQQRPIPLRYLHQLKGRDFMAFPGEKIR